MRRCPHGARSVPNWSAQWTCAAKPFAVSEVREHRPPRCRYEGARETCLAPRLISRRMAAHSAATLLATLVASPSAADREVPASDWAGRGPSSPAGAAAAAVTIAADAGRLVDCACFFFRAMGSPGLVADQRGRIIGSAADRYPLALPCKPRWTEQYERSALSRMWI